MIVWFDKKEENALK